MIGGVGGDVHRHAGMFPLEDRQQRGEPVIPGVALGADANAPVGLAPQPADVRFGHLDVAQDPPRGFEHAASRRGQHHLAPDADEERRLEPGFDVAQLVAEGGLGEKEPLRGPGHAAGVGDFGDQPQMTDLEVHGGDPSI